MFRVSFSKVAHCSITRCALHCDHLQKRVRRKKGEGKISIILFDRYAIGNVFLLIDNARKKQAKYAYNCTYKRKMYTCVCK